MKKIYNVAIENDFKKMSNNANDLIEKNDFKTKLVALASSIEYYDDNL